MAQQTPEDRTSDARFAIHDRSRALTASGGKWGLSGLFAGILLPLLELFNEGFGLFLVGEGEASGAVFELERMEKCTVLVVMEIIVDFLVPDDTSSGGLDVGCQHNSGNWRRGGKGTHRDVDQLQPESTADQIIRKHSRTLQTGINPSLRVGIGDIEPRDRDSMDLVGGFGDIALDGFFVGVSEDGGHDELLLVTGRIGYGREGRFFCSFPLI